MPSQSTGYEIRRSLVERKSSPDVITSRVLAVGVVRAPGGSWEMLHRLDAGISIRMVLGEDLLADVVGTAIAAMPKPARVRVMRAVETSLCGDAGAVDASLCPAKGDAL